MKYKKFIFIAGISAFIVGTTSLLVFGVLFSKGHRFSPAKALKSNHLIGKELDIIA